VREGKFCTTQGEEEKKRAELPRMGDPPSQLERQPRLRDSRSSLRSYEKRAGGYDFTLASRPYIPI
jgi:hypothetical protein